MTIAKIESQLELLPKTQVKKQLFWTNGCYRAALLEHYDGSLSAFEKKMNINDIKRIILYDWREEIAPEVHDGYMRRLLALDSKKLSVIVQAFQTGQQYRKQETIEAIMTELFERSTANPETRGKHES